LDKKICNQCDSNCKTCQIKSTNCTDCESNYFLEENKCYECTECKEKYSYNCKCISCHEGKYLTNYQCKDCDKSCKKCELEAKRCLECYDGNYLSQFQCLPCFSRCKKCYLGPDGTDNHHCLSCFDEYLYYKGNCVDECPEGYYEKDKNCEQCNILCKTIGANCTQCESCLDGYYLIKDEYNCKKCSEHCKTCLEGESGENENCLTCDEFSDYKYLVKAEGFGNNCVEKCPNGTVLENNFCINEKKGNSSGASTFLIFILVGLGSLLIILTVIFVFVTLRSRKKKLNIRNSKIDEKLVDQINKDLGLYQSFEGN
jgi:hypothetical protein